MAHGDSYLQTGQLQVNLIPEEDHSFATSIGSWTSTNSTLAIEYDDTFYSNYNSLRVTPTDYSDIVLTFDPVTTRSIDALDNLDFHFRIKTQVDAVVTVGLDLSGEDSTSRASATAGNVWRVVRSQPIDIPQTAETYDVTATITVSQHGGLPFLISVPVAMPEFGFTNNRFVRECVPLMPSVFNDFDLGQSFPTFPMYRFMDLGLTAAGVGYGQLSHFRYRDVSNGRDTTDEDTLSALVDPSVCEARFLPWLSQFTGTQYVDPTIRTTPWANLPANWLELMEDIDPTPQINFNIISISRTSGVVSAVLDGDVTPFTAGNFVIVSNSGTFSGQYEITSQNIGTSTLEWLQAGSDETDSVGEVGLIDQSWIEIEAFRIDITNRIEFLRWQVINQFYGIKAGTLEALEQTVKFYLTGNKTVTIYPKHQGVPFLIKVFTKTSETPGGIDGESSQEIIDALAFAKPAGFKIEHECNADGSDSLFVLGSSVDGLLSSSLL